MLKCGNCKYNDDCTKVIRIEMENCTEYRPVTNADRIRVMTDEELAEWIHKHDCHTNLYGDVSKEAVLDWLKQEAKPE